MIDEYASMPYFVWPRKQVEAYVGDPTAYDIDAIIRDMDDTGASLAEAAERHELVSFWPAA